MSDIGLKLALKHARKRLRLDSIQCSNCGTTDIRVLQETVIESKRLVLCAECRIIMQGKTIYEVHHVIGRKNDDFKIVLPANDHAILTEMYMEINNLPNDKRLLQWLYALMIILKRVMEIIKEVINLLEEKQ